MEAQISAGLVALLVSVSSAAASTNHDVTAFELLDDGSVVVPVTIHGTGPYRFVLDTGSSRTVISTRLARVIARPTPARTLMVTPAGPNATDVVRLDGLGIEGRPAKSLLVAVLPQDHYASGRQIDGLIGQDVLVDETYSVDYQRRLIKWHSPEEDLPGVRLPLSVRDNRLVVSVAQRADDSDPVKLIPDSGADGVVIFSHAANKLRFTMHEIGVLSSVSGVRLARRIVIDGLQIGNTMFRNQPAAMVAANRDTLLMGDGLLPLHLFSRVTFNVAGGFVIFHPR